PRRVSRTNQSGWDFVIANPDSTATLQCSLDGGTWTACTTSSHFVAATQTSHTLEARAVDAAGNGRLPAGPFVWTLDTSAPEPAQILSGPSSPTKETTADFDFVPSDQTDPRFNGFTCSRDGAPCATCVTDSAFLAGPCTEGSHSLQVKTVDSSSPTPNV